MTDTTYSEQEPTTSNPYQTTEGEKVYTVTGGDWDTVMAPPDGEKDRLIVNMGPQHPSTHGVLRMIVELDGEAVTQMRCAIGYLHTGIEKNMEFRTWTQGTTFVTRMDYVAGLHNELVYSLAVEKLLGITDDIPERANVIRVMMSELARVSSHLVAIATGGMELGALTGMTQGFRDREPILDLFEAITGLRMNNAYIRPGGVAVDLPAGIEKTIRETVANTRKRSVDTVNLLIDNAIWLGRTQGVGYLDLAGCMALGITGPILRATGLPWDLRKSNPYCGFENYEFEVPTQTTCDVYGRFLIRMEEIQQSLNIVDQCL
ncbi:MAG: NADH-quinone oxidoreductase subunit D, partial [Candidatus Nanopelagicales bacterium]